MIDLAALQMVVGVLTGWLERREREAVAYLIEENRLLRRWLGTRRLCLTDDDLASRRVQILGCTPHPEALFMQQIVRTLTMAEAGVVSRRQVLICDRDQKWSRDVRVGSGTRASAWC